ncbi:MAG: DUF2007 domain-containing protein [Marinilabiliales bacterium]|nr:MAG: DUF2007 domain-containing protein [Marinilabiliales bacterium]
MTNQEDLAFLYSGTEINAKILKEILEDNDIGSLIKNDMKSGLTAGFGGGYAEAEASLFVAEKNLEKAKTLLKQFLDALETE